ncbi:hypothetical protein JNN96_29830 [Mycobacterium sp. DSM 3803]|nr:hypothetical protein [Mycobacterium sp. DSM 3803]
MTGKISIKDRGVVQGHINGLTATQTKLTTAAQQARTEHAAVIAALGVSVDGNTGGTAPAAGNPGAQADAAATALGTATTGMQSWLDGLEVIDQEGATGVETESGSGDFGGVTASGTVNVSPQATPYSTSGGSTGGSSPYPAAK